MILEEFITRSNSASSQEEVFALFQRALNDLGYDSVVYRGSSQRMFKILR